MICKPLPICQIRSRAYGNGFAGGVMYVPAGSLNEDGIPEPMLWHCVAKLRRRKEIRVRYSVLV